MVEPLLRIDQVGKRFGGFTALDNINLDVAPGERLDMPDLMRRLMAAGLPPRLYRHVGQWLDVGRPEDYAIAQRWAAGEGRLESHL